VPWRVEILNETVAAEIAALPADMQARFLRLAERIASAGLESLSEPQVKHLEGKLWELRLTAAMELPALFTSRRSAAGSSWSARS
jgi:primosomal protein N''